MSAIRARWADGAPAIGAFVAIASEVTAEIMGGAGFDWVLIDQQHGRVPQSSLLPMLNAIPQDGADALVRVGENDLMGTCRALDLGATGVVVPMVDTAAQAERCARACRFPPLGDRSFGSLRGYRTVGEANDDIVCVVMIESPEAVANAEEIANIEGVDALLIGPADLSLRLGAGPVQAPDSPGLSDAIEAVVAACTRNGTHAGFVARDAADARCVIERGVTLISLHSDVGYVAAGAARDVTAMHGLRAASHNHRSTPPVLQKQVTSESKRGLM